MTSPTIFFAPADQAPTNADEKLDEVERKKGIRTVLGGGAELPVKLETAGQPARGVLYGRIRYRDQFQKPTDTPHESKFCVVYTAADDSWQPCASFNNAD